ncbi:MAG: hypothetical protein J5895_02235 [Alphaproteobacteria bacterium]|nr:hypothetical protein [Alphaproteobacteria bacterium]
MANVKKQLFLTESNSSVKIRADKKLVCEICVVLLAGFLPLFGFSYLPIKDFFLFGFTLAKTK